MAKNNANNTGNPSGFKEFLRKVHVGLKRKPSVIPFLVMVVAFLVYSLRLSNISDTTARIQGTGMGLAGFATMLFSLLSFVACLNAFPKRKKANIPMLIVLFVMLGIILYCDFVYIAGINAAYARAAADGTTLISDNTKFIPKAMTTVKIHRVIIIIDIALIILLPVYGKFIRNIKTSIEVEGNEEMGDIDISGEE